MSPRRRQLLRALNLPFTAHTADIDETPVPGELPVDLVCRLSREKAQAVAGYYPQAVIIAADTIVVFNGQILGKPADPAQAKAMLTEMSGRSHTVYSALTLLQAQTERLYTTLSATTVTMRPYTPAEIDAYIATGDPMDKAGAYAIQHPQFAPVATLDGCYAGVMGFPLGLLAEGLAQFGVKVENVGPICAAQTGARCCVYRQA